MIAMVVYACRCTSADWPGTWAEIKYLPTSCVTANEPFEMKDIGVSKEPVELFKILKFEGMAASGGEAKSLIADGQVTVNGQVETRKRRKIVSGDIIEFGGEKYLIELNS